jgi:DnaJ domain
MEPHKLREVMLALGVRPEEMVRLQQVPLETARALLEELKERVRKNYKQLAFELHPDRTGNDPVKTERFKLIGTVKDEFEKLQVQARQQPQFIPRPPMQPQPQMRVMRVVTWTSAGTAYTSTASTGTTTHIHIGVPFRVATMKPT